MIRLFAEHRTAANLLMAAILGLGLLALPQLQRDTFPVIPAESVEVRIVWPGALPADVENALCLPVEDALRAIPEIDEMRCDARAGLMILTADMVEGRRIETFHDDVQQAVLSINRLPDRARTPTIRTLERVARVGAIAVSGPMPDRDLFRYAHAIRERIAADPRIASVAVNGFSDREIAIDLSAAALRRFRLTPADVADAIARQSLDLSAGRIETREGDTTIRIAAERRRAAAFAAIPVLSASLGAEIPLGDVATITERFTEPHVAAFHDGARAALVEVTKTEAQDALAVMAALQEHLAREQATAPEGVRLVLAQDSTTNIRDRLRILTDNAAQGLVAVFLVMWAFFGLRLSFWVAAGLPVSFLGAIFAMNVLGLSINMITMVALLVAIGLLMDDAIVISENIVARRQKGDAPLQAVVGGALEVMPGVVSSFLTTIMVVGPLALMQGQMGQILKFMPIVLVLVLAISLLEAFLVLPHHLKGSLDRLGRRSRFHRAVDAGFAALRDRAVVPLVGLALRFRYLTLGLVLALLVVSVIPVTAGWLKFQPFPTLDSDTVEARILLPQGTPLGRTEAVVARIEAALARVNAEFTPQQPGGVPLVQEVTTTFGSNPDAPESGAHLATISAALLRAEARSTAIGDIIAAWRRETGPVPDVVALRFTDRERGPSGKPIDIRLTGPDLDRLSAASREVQRHIRGYAGLRDLTDDLRPGEPEWQVDVRPGAAGALGLTPRAVADQLRAALSGDTSLEIQDPAGAIDVTVRLSPQDRVARADLLDLPLRAADGSAVPLSAVADIVETRGWARILRIDGVRTVTVEGSIDPKVVNARELLAATRRDFLPELMARYPEIGVTIAGESRETATTGASLRTGLLVGLTGVYIILAVQFASFLTPLAVLIAMPLGIIGVVWGHLWLGMALSMPSLVGFATLGGIVVNNAILLVAFIGNRLARGGDLDAALRGAVADRFRAIMLTSITTVVGLTPLLMERSTQAQFLRPIVASLAFGLTTATLLALIVVPVVVRIMADLGHDPAGKAEAGAVAAPAPALG